VTGVTLVPMERRHLEAVAELEGRCFSEPWSFESFLSETENPIAVYLVAEQDGQAAGYAGMHVILGEGHITNVAVSPEFRRRGIGRRLCEGLIRKAARRSLRSLTLEVRASNFAAQDMYRRLGFAEVGRRKGYYQTPDEDAILMTREAETGDEYFGI